MTNEPVKRKMTMTPEPKGKLDIAVGVEVEHVLMRRGDPGQIPAARVHDPS